MHLLTTFLSLPNNRYFSLRREAIQIQRMLQARTVNALLLHDQVHGLEQQFAQTQYKSEVDSDGKAPKVNLNKNGQH